MSAQTGTTAPAGPVSRRIGDQAAFRWHKLLDEPNPLWIRELRQSARLVRTPIILCVLSVLLTLAIAAVGGLVSMYESPATTGYVIFQVFFSLMYFVVTFMGPGVAANSIASEREGRTWEAVTLTGLRPAVIARGKFLAAYTAICMYIVMLAPVGALPFLFGGVTATETIVAFLFLFLIAGLAVAFGLAISSKMASLRAAIVVTLICAFVASLAAYWGLGYGLSFGAHELWSGVPDGPPVWLPSAYARAPFDLQYVLLLIVLPVALAMLPAWYLYEVTIANLTSITDDRSTGLKRWYLVCTPIFMVCAAVPAAIVAPSDRKGACVAGLSLMFLFLMFGVYLFIADSLGPSRRVVLHWDRLNVSRFGRFLGPGLIKTSMMQLVMTAATLTVPVLVGLIALPGGPGAGTNAVGIVMVAVYAAGFVLFSVGLGAFLRARSSAAMLPRVLLLAVHTFVAIGPWVVAAIAGIFASPAGREALVIAAPSPVYVFLALDALDRGKEELLVAGAFFTAVVWAMLGAMFLALARMRARRIITQHDAALAETDRLLAEEDARAATQAPVAV